MTRILVTNREKTELNAFGRIIPITCDVRNLENGERKMNEVVRTEPAPGVPYSPQVFPTGPWLITRIDKETDPDLAPYFIGTNAGQWVDEWAIDTNGCYLRKTGRRVWDSAYGIHNSVDIHTFGCFRVLSTDDLMFLVRSIWAAWSGYEPTSAGDRVEVDVA